VRLRNRWGERFLSNSQTGKVGDMNSQEVKLSDFVKHLNERDRPCVELSELKRRVREMLVKHHEHVGGLAHGECACDFCKLYRDCQEEAK